jgi:hypothetical protein
MDKNKLIKLCGCEFYHNCDHKYGQLCMKNGECDYQSDYHKNGEKENE